MLTNCQSKAYFEIQRACDVTLKNILISYPQRMELLGRQPLCLILSGILFILERMSWLSPDRWIPKNFTNVANL